MMRNGPEELLNLTAISIFFFDKVFKYAFGKSLPTIDTIAHSIFFVFAAKLANGAEPPITLSTFP